MHSQRSQAIAHAMLTEAEFAAISARRFLGTLPAAFARYSAVEREAILTGLASDCWVAEPKYSQACELAGVEVPLEEEGGPRAEEICPQVWERSDGAFLVWPADCSFGALVKLGGRL